MKVLKFGGSSIATPQRMKKVLSLVSSEEATPKVVVLSAIAGVTDKLVALYQAYAEGQEESYAERREKLRDFHLSYAQELLQTVEHFQIAADEIEEQFKKLAHRKKAVQLSLTEGQVLATGEYLSTFLFHLYLQEVGHLSHWLYAPDYLWLEPDEKVDLEKLSLKLLPVISNSGASIFIIQGFICRRADQRIGNLKRGGSDYTASLLGAALQVQEIQIWTDIDGLHNNDPRYVAHTRAIAVLSYDEAAELAYFGAKILHPQTIHPARLRKVPVRLLDTLHPTAKGTLITQEAPVREVVAIAAKEGITAITVHSSRMLMAYGFLKKLFEVFEGFKTPIDMITTSEVAVSLTIDQDAQLPALYKALQEFGTVHIDKDQAIICVVGNFSSETHGKAAVVMDALKHLPIRMISYGGSTHNLSVLLPQKHKVEALRALHSRLF